MLHAARNILTHKSSLLRFSLKKDKDLDFSTEGTKNRKHHQSLDLGSSHRTWYSSSQVFCRCKAKQTHICMFLCGLIRALCWRYVDNSWKRVLNYWKLLPVFMLLAYFSVQQISAGFKRIVTQIRIRRSGFSEDRMRASFCHQQRL